MTSFIAVSYTHLDVYKRQDQLIDVHVGEQVTESSRAFNLMVFRMPSNRLHSQIRRAKPAYVSACYVESDLQVHFLNVHLQANSVPLKADYNSK
ncbi:hypothetical protein T4E_249 [Trichinella pseudospiralis]|uniref:Uncharacterized protein n=1 Tax=Trichinella pseudospiralis TaxID=6337 RepID=A0A0V0WR61_TRIPS|nr:hypothetical protein T4E_249 [Trichinella pseudospiralis]